MRTQIPERLPRSIAGLEMMCKHVIRATNGGEIAEVGAWTGAGTQIFSKYFTRVYAIDPWSGDLPEIASRFDMKEVERIFDERLSDMENVTKIKVTSAIAAGTFPDGSLEAVYIDALHEYKSVREDMIMWRPKVKPGGFLCGHDYCNKFPGVMRAVRELVKGFVVFPDTSWAVQL